MLDLSGFTRRSYQDILKELISQAQATISPDVATGSDSVIGSMLRVMAYELAKEEELQEAVWFSGFVSQAVGISLDRLAANIGLYRNPAENATVELTLNGVAGTKIAEQTLFGTVENINFFAAESGELLPTGQMDTDGKTALGSLKILAVSVDQSTRANVASGRINQMIESISGLRSVTNAEAAQGGVALETDSSLRARLIDNYKKSANGTVPSLITQVENMTGVSLVHVVANNNLTTDSFGNPGKSVHFYVQGGDDTAVAKAILNSVVAGVATVGATSITLPLISGVSTQVVKFDRPSQKVVDITIKLVTNEDFSVFGNDDVKSAIISYMSTLKIGEPLYISRLVAAAYSVTGIVDAAVTVKVAGVTVTTPAVTPQQFEFINYGTIGVTE